MPPNGFWQSCSGISLTSNAEECVSVESVLAALSLEDLATNGLAILTNPSHRIMATMTPRRHCADVKAKGLPVVVYEPTLDEPEFFGSEVTHDLEPLRPAAT